MDSSNEMDVVEVSKKLLGELEDMGFPLARAARALHHSGNSGIEAAVNWIIDHENDPNIDQMPVIAVNIDIECPPQQIHTMEAKALDLRDKTRKKRDEEEKKLERAREKERIHAGKEISQAKRIAEDSERRRYLAQKKAEREEEKRARQRIKLKLDEDKAERRRMLGLPPVTDTTIQNARPSCQEKKQVYVKSVEKAEQLRECLRSIKQNHQDEEATVKKAFETLLIYVGNVARNPDVEMYRKIRISNPAFQSRVGRLIGGIEFLGLCGFEIIEEGKLLYLPGDKVDMAVLNSAGSELKSAITNPFFGLISRPYSRI